MPDHEVLTAAEVADLLQIHWRTIYRMRERGEGPPAVKIGRMYRYPRAALEEWLERQASAPARKEVTPATGPRT